VARRNFGPFALVAVPVLTRCATAALQTSREQAPWLDRWMRLGRNDAPDTARARVIRRGSTSLVALLGLVAIGKLYVVTQPAFVGYHIASGYPARAVRWLVDHRSGGETVQ